MERSVDRPLDPSAILLMTLVCAIWGGAFVAIKINLLDMPPFGAAALRFLVTALVLFLLARAQHMALWQTAQDMRLVALLAVLFFYSNFMVYVGTAQTTSGRATVFFYSQPVFFALLAHYLLPGDRLTVRKGWGLFLAFSGLVLLFLMKMSPGHSSFTLLGDSLVLSSALATAYQNLLMKQTTGRVHPVALIFWGSLISGVLLACCSAALEPQARFVFSLRALAALFYLSFVSAAFGFVVFAWLIQRYSATRVTTLVFLAPAFGVLFGWLFLQETLTLVQLFGAVGVCLGVYFVSSSEKLTIRQTPTTETSLNTQAAIR
ncbi:MAG TPA: DMT family transporter [Methylomirabilota bacterium]|nr:DMT family transporter [Methylomirabilota bacterium]